MNRTLRLIAACLMLAGCGPDDHTDTSGKTTSPTAAAQWAEQLSERRGALVDEVIFTQERDLGKVAGMIDGGTYQVFSQGITNTTVYQRLRDAPNAAYDMAYGSTAELTLNPVGPTFQDGSLNPFSVPDIREALNWLINRRYIAEELYDGLAAPRTLPLSSAFPDYARLAETARKLELAYSHNPERARRVITQHMQTLGAELKEGLWHFQNQPVTLKLLIRSEDTRKQVGDYVGNLLEDIGFQTSRQYRTAEEGARIWFGGDPAAGEWHLYTGGWVSTVINRDESQNLSMYYTPRGRPAPLWQAYQPDPELDRLAERLERRDYRNWEERQAMMARALELALQDSVRVWIVDQFNVFPRASQLRVASDLAGGITGSRLWPYTLHYANRLGGQVVFAAPSVLTEPWNPVAGSNWLFDSMIYRSLNDPAALPNPFTGLYHPQRLASAEVWVESGAPVNTTLDWVSVTEANRITVPGDAWIGWDETTASFTSVAQRFPDGMQARTRTRLHYQEGLWEQQWHDGSRLSIADLLLPLILTFSRANPDSPLYDASYVPAFEVYQRHFRGVKIVSQTPLVIDVYSDQIFPDAETIAAQRAPELVPWHTLAVGIRAEITGDLAFSSHKADRQQITWMNYVAGPSLATLARHLSSARQQKYLPYDGVLSAWVSDDQRQQRYQALQTWHRARGHFWVDNGPFYLHGVHPVERTLVLRRNEQFPDPADKWLAFSQADIPEAVLDGPMMVPQGQSARFTATITLRGKPYPVNALSRVQYLLFDSHNQLQHEGLAEHAGGANWRIDLEPDTLQKLASGTNSLEVAVLSDRVALPTFVSHAFASVPKGTQTLEDKAP